MARVSTYLNFLGNTETAFEFYKSVFKTEYTQVQRMGDMPAGPGMPELSAAEKKSILHIELPITGGHALMASDALESLGHKLHVGNNTHLNVEPDSRAEATRLFNALAEGGKITMPLADMFWGAYWGSLTDKFGVQWMINTNAK